ncbi:hemolysin family protein [Ornithinimicrobium humiphilum]|uniref:CBS domain containing-hemolysin-like protein n=1 Tax=Ornithinimicrobium humiphilum TaxID=125288 RepID=A0A543KKM9_9MICO|nr:hemolysin family protein [Ornithinimicrobium humiphilum]TQM95633.1 CBS domain containing-hemolysin-like protein [Ornithinimicrobium humiphilum]
MLIATGIAVIVVLTLFTGYFVAQEFAYVSVDRGRLRQLADEGDQAAARALRITSRLSFTLSGAQFGITVTALMVGYLGEELLVRGLTESYADIGWLARAAMISLFSIGTLVFSTVLQMVIGELGPKNLAIARPVPLARALSRTTLIYLTILGPVIRLFDMASNALLRSVGIDPVEELPQGATPEDLTRIIAESHSGGTLDEELSTLLGRGLAFRERVAQEVMTPRTSVHTVQADETAATVLEALHTGHARFPVVGRDIDDVVGVIGLHGLLQVDPEDRATTVIRDLCEDAVILPESLPLPKVLEALRTHHQQLAVVVDEYGGFAGIVTFEDVAEEVVGEIWDEDDAEESTSQDRGDGIWDLSARLRIDEVAQLTGIELPESENYDTLSGLVLDRLGRTAEEGDSVLVRWTSRDGEGDEYVHQTRLDVVTTQRFVPETVVMHPQVTRTMSAWAALTEEEREQLSSDATPVIVAAETPEVAR